MRSVTNLSLYTQATQGKQNNIKVLSEFDLITTCIPSLKCIKMFVHIGEILWRPMAWILLLKLLSCLPFAR